MEGVRPSGERTPQRAKTSLRPPLAKQRAFALDGDDKRGVPYLFRHRRRAVFDSVNPVKSSVY